MKRSTRGCGCAIAVLVLVTAAGGFAFFKWGLPWWKSLPPRASGGELQVRVLDVGPIEGDSILIVSPTGKSVLIDAGDKGKGKGVLSQRRGDSKTGWERFNEYRQVRIQPPLAIVKLKSPRFLKDFGGFSILANKLLTDNRETKQDILR